MRYVDRALRVVLLIAWMGMITFWSSQSVLPIDQPLFEAVFHGFQHRLAHLTVFGILGLLALWAFEGLPRRAVLAVVLTSVFGAADEYHQSFTPGRRAAVDDWLMDTGSAALAVYLWYRLRAHRRFAVAAVKRLRTAVT